MKKITAAAGIFVLFLAMTASVSAMSLNNAGTDDAENLKIEKQFTRNTLTALSSGHAGLQQGALRMIIQYGDQVNFRSAIFDVMRIYRTHSDVKMRQMAVVALGKMESRVAVDYLRRVVQFEKSECVRKTMLAVIAEHA